MHLSGFLNSTAAFMLAILAEYITHEWRHAAAYRLAGVPCGRIWSSPLSEVIRFMFRNPFAKADPERPPGPHTRVDGPVSRRQALIGIGGPFVSAWLVAAVCALIGLSASNQVITAIGFGLAAFSTAASWRDLRWIASVLTSSRHHFIDSGHELTEAEIKQD
jgi:hypothetical protein